MTECNGCGSCCDPVFLTHAMAVKRETLLTPQGDQLREMLTPLGPSKSGEGIVFECMHFDKHERRCTNYEGRPEMCSGYPWYGGAPKEGVLGLTCSFQADLGRTVLPIVEVR